MACADGPETILLAGDQNEAAAAKVGQATALLLQDMVEEPGLERFRTLQRLRVAARKCPLAALTLGDWLGTTNSWKMRARRKDMAFGLYQNSAGMSLERLRDPDEPYSDAPTEEHVLRDIMSRALVGIGRRYIDCGWPEAAEAYFRRALDLFPGNDIARKLL